LRLFDSDGYRVAKNDDFCGNCSKIANYQVTGDCQTYTIQEGETLVFDFVQNFFTTSYSQIVTLAVAVGNMS